MFTTMQVDISAHIEKLLFLHDSLMIPGLGGFMAVKSPARTDVAGGKIFPPTKSLSFYENLQADDGLLSGDIARTYGISVDEATRMVDEMVQNIQQQLGQREIVSLSGVGRLYKNYMQKIQFLPDSTNFNTEAFGLPPIQFSPIARSREVLDTVPETPFAAAPTPPRTKTLPVTETPARSSRRLSPVLSILGTLVLLGGLLFGIWWWRSGSASPDEEQVVQQDLTDYKAPENKPVKKTPIVPETPVEEPQVTPEKTPEAAASERMAEARKQVKSAQSGSKECILIVATLQDKNNAERLRKTLANAGYTVYFVQKKGWQVGIQFRYNNLSEVQAQMKALQTLTGEEQIWIKKK